MTDTRSHFALPHVAHDHLRGFVDAPKFTSGTFMRVVVPVAPLLSQPNDRGPARECIFGARVTCLDVQDGLAFVRDADMGYVGWMPQGALGPWQEPTHIVAARATLAFEAPDFKSPDPVALSLGSQVTVTASSSRYAETTDGRFIVASHLRPVDQVEADPVVVAERMLGAPYLWGGNSSFGLDCSGLVQRAMAACGMACPGDSDQQAAALGQTLPPGTPVTRGDLLFWRGHVAWVAGPDRLIHANAGHMAVAYEGVKDAIQRIKDHGDGEVTRHARL